MPTPFAQTASTRSAAIGASRPGRRQLGLAGPGSPSDTPAEQFANWLPYSAYLAAEKIFVNRDSMGFMLEPCRSRAPTSAWRRC
jgi:conjugal transfer ATP-binding protein TraC